MQLSSVSKSWVSLGKSIVYNISRNLIELWELSVKFNSIVLNSLIAVLL